MKEHLLFQIGFEGGFLEKKILSLELRAKAIFEEMYSWGCSMRERHRVWSSMVFVENFTYNASDWKWETGKQGQANSERMLCILFVSRSCISDCRCLEIIQSFYRGELCSQMCASERIMILITSWRCVWRERDINLSKTICQLYGEEVGREGEREGFTLEHPHADKIMWTIWVKCGQWHKDLAVDWIWELHGKNHMRNDIWNTE